MKKYQAFTLIELLVVMSIISLLVSILLPTLKAVRSQARISVCSSNLRQTNIGSRIYANDYKDYFPARFNNAALTELVPMTFGNGVRAFGWESVALLISDSLGAEGSYLATKDVLFCPDDTTHIRPDPDNWGYRSDEVGRPRFSYFNIYIDKAGESAFPGMARNRYGFGAHADKLVVLYDQGYIDSIEPLYPFYHQTGWNLAYLDGHVSFGSRPDIEAEYVERGGSLSSWVPMILWRLLDEN